MTSITTNDPQAPFALSRLAVHTDLFDRGFYFHRNSKIMTDARFVPDPRTDQ